MLEKSNDNRTLPEVFKELQNIRNAQVKSYKKVKKKNNNFIQRAISNIATKTTSVASVVVLIFAIMTAFTGYIFATNSGEEKNEVIGEYEENNNVINVEKIISNNISVVTSKQLITEDRDIKYDTVYQKNNKLPKDEQVVVQEGKNGKENVTAVKRYENGNYKDESILSRNIIQEPIKQIVQVGTSEFLKKYNVHIGDKMYLLSQADLKSETKDTSATICNIPQNLDVKLLDISKNWCKVSYGEYEGFIKINLVTSATINPEIAEACRILKIKNKFNIDMELNKPSGLTLDDFKKILSNNSNDKNNIFEDNAEVFYNIEQKYNINGVFVAAIGIHESAWGNSTISKDKRNLFGYGAYDRDPYSYSYEFETYQDAIETVAKALVKFYINEPGTPIYDGEVAKGSYYNGATLAGVNVRYASDKNWYTKVYSKMEDLYNKL